ncbi:hypothetical protein ACWD4T_53905, partial [Streptomyces umbrinus]
MNEGDVGESRAPDFFDRLLARHTPAAAPRPGVARVRPRLAGPFERVEAVRAGAQEPETAEPLWPTSAQSPTSDGDLARPAAVREVQFRMERERTVVRAERASSDEPSPRPVARDLPEAPLLRPAVPVAPGPRPVPDTARRSAGRGEPERSSPSAVSVPLPSGTATASPAAVCGARGPPPAETAAAPGPRP